MRSVEDSIARGTGATARPSETAQRRTVGDAARGHRGVRLRCLIGGARRDEEKARAKERMFSFRDEIRPVGPEEPAARAVGPLQRPRAAGREHARVPDHQLDRTRRLAVHRSARSCRCRRSTTRTGAKSCAGAALLVPVTAGDAAARRRGASRQVQVRFRTVGDITCTCPVRVDAATVERDHRRDGARTTITERGATRMDDQTSEASMELRKKEGTSDDHAPIEQDRRDARNDTRRAALHHRRQRRRRQEHADRAAAVRHQGDARGPARRASSATSRRARADAHRPVAADRRAARPSASRASPSTSPTATSPRRGASSSSPTRPATSSTRATWSPAPAPPMPP